MAAVWRQDCSWAWALSRSAGLAPGRVGRGHVLHLRLHDRWRCGGVQAVCGKQYLRGAGAALAVRVLRLQRQRARARLRGARGSHAARARARARGRRAGGARTSGAPARPRAGLVRRDRGARAFALARGCQGGAWAARAFVWVARARAHGGHTGAGGRAARVRQRGSGGLTRNVHSPRPAATRSASRRRAGRAGDRRGRDGPMGPFRGACA